MKIPVYFFISICISISSKSNEINFYTAIDTEKYCDIDILFLVATIWQMFSLKGVVILTLGAIAFFFYYKLGTLKNHFKDLEDDFTRQTEGLRSANTILAKKNDEIYKQVSKIIIRQEQVLKQNFQLEYKAESLRRLNISKDHLIATLISDLENPVVSLAEIAESLNETLPRLDKKEISVFLNTIHGCSHDINATLSNLVNWDQLQTKYKKYNPSDFYIGDLIKSNVVLLTQELSQKRLQIDFQVDDDHKIVADQSMMNIVIRNLLVSAIKTAVNESIVIESAQTENKIVICISHSASAATMVQCEHLLHNNAPFFSSVNIGGPISALALTIVREFVQINNGRIRVKYEDDKRLVYTIQLTKSSRVIERNGSQQSIKGGDEAAVEVMPIKGSSVLIADESAELRTYVKRILSPAFKVSEAKSGSEALEMVHKLMPKLIISEVNLPDVNGLQFCKLIQENKATRQIPFVFLTSEWEAESKSKGLNAGADVYLVKPVGKDTLLQTVINQIAQRKPGKSLPMDDERNHEGVTKNDEQFLEKVIAFIEENLPDPDLDHRKICEYMTMSKSVLYIKFRTVTGQGVQEFIKMMRLQKSLNFLLEGNMTINQVAMEVGFNSQSYFNKCFVKQFGMSPKEYMRQNRKSSVDA
jgi:CheY-like chemotaxis protein/AraC-like DNA-binding protein